MKNKYWLIEDIVLLASLILILVLYINASPGSICEKLLETCIFTGVCLSSVFNLIDSYKKNKKVRFILYILLSMACAFVIIKKVIL